jgi:hypothetical protein
VGMEDGHGDLIGTRPPSGPDQTSPGHQPRMAGYPDGLEDRLTALLREAHAVLVVADAHGEGAAQSVPGAATFRSMSASPDVRTTSGTRTSG